MKVVAREPDEPGRPFRSLASTLIRSIVAAAAICTLLVVAIQLVFTYHTQRRTFEAEVHSIAQINVPLLSVNVWDIEPDAVRRQMKLIAERPQIAYAGLEAVSGQEFESGDSTRRSDPKATTLDIPYPAGKPGKLGTLRISANLNYLYGELAGDALRVLASAVLLTGLTCVLVTVILRRQLQLPMQRIAEFAGSLGTKEITRPFNLPRPYRRWRDEIDKVADGFRMLQDDIRQHVEDLDRQVAHRTAELECANARLEGLSRRDPMTGLANRRHFEQERSRAWKEMMASGRPLSLMMIDIDYFKHYNDTYGHAAGDDCLVAIARHLQQTFQRLGELPVRMGGEEFAVLLDNCVLAEAVTRAEAFRREIHELGLVHAKSAHRRVTVSIGVSSVDPRELFTSMAEGDLSAGMTHLLGRADQALYEAKAGGRNRVVGLPLEAATAIA